MLEFGERVDHRRLRELGQLLDVAMPEQPGHDHRSPARQVGGDILDRRALAQADVGLRQIHGVAAQLLNRRFERHAGAKRRLLEYERDRAVFHRADRGRRDVPALFQVRGEVEHLADLRIAQVVDGQNVPQWLRPFGVGGGIFLDLGRG